MLDSSTLRLLWLIIEQKKVCIFQELSDSEIVQHILGQLKAEMYLSAAELSDTHLYVQSRIPLIRDLTEIQFVNGK